MKKILSLLFSGLVYFTAQAQNTGIDTARSLLWKISNKDMKHPSYLFGTIHLICPADFVWTASMQKALESANELCLEMDMDDPQLMVAIAKGMMSADGKELKAYFSEQQYQSLERYLMDSLGMNIAMFNQMKPVALQTVFLTKVANCPEPLTYENVIMEKAAHKNIEVTGLEDPSEQIALLDDIPTDSVIQIIMDIVEGKESGRSEYNEMVDAYKKQDIKTLHEIMQMHSDGSFNLDMLLDQRNEKWVERIIDKMDQHAVFFAVGAGHLPGQKGVINLLRQEGYTVEPVY